MSVCDSGSVSRAVTQLRLHPLQVSPSKLHSETA